MGGVLAITYSNKIVLARSGKSEKPAEVKGVQNTKVKAPSKVGKGKKAYVNKWTKNDAGERVLNPEHKDYNKFLQEQRNKGV